MENEKNKNNSNIKFLLRAFQYRNYRLYFGGQTVSLTGTWMQMIAMGWLVYHLTNSAFLLGLIGFIGQIPIFVLTPFAGVYIDRWNRQNTLIVTQILATIQAFILALLVLTGEIRVWQILLLNLTLGIINAFDMPGRQAILVDLVEKREDLGNAIALNSLMVNIARLLGPTLAGLLIAVIGEGWCFMLNAISFLPVIWALYQIKTNQVQKQVNDKVMDGLKEGFKYAFNFPPIKAIILLLALISLMGMPYTVLMPIFAKDIFHGGPKTLGILMGASGMGALFGGAYLASRKKVMGLEKVIALNAGLFGMSIAVFSMSKILLFSVFLIFISGFGMVVHMAAGNTVLQTIVDDDKRGRLMSFFTVAFIGVSPFGSLISGWLASLIGAPNTLLLGGIFCVLGALVFARKLPEFREIIHPIYVKKGIVPD